jgi:hypothetical protein
VLRDLTDDVRAILEPLQFGARRRRPDCLFALFAMIAVLHLFFPLLFMHEVALREMYAKGLRNKATTRKRMGPPVRTEGPIPDQTVEV